jgi:hypothetical protein
MVFFLVFIFCVLLFFVLLLLDLLKSELLPLFAPLPGCKLDLLNRSSSLRRLLLGSDDVSIRILSSAASAL